MKLVRGKIHLLIDQSKKKKKVSFVQIRNELELANYTLLNEQFRLGLTSYKKNKKLQKTIHEKEGWRDYTR
jgi:hypothetical protein